MDFRRCSEHSLFGVVSITVGEMFMSEGAGQLKAVCRQPGVGNKSIQVAGMSPCSAAACRNSILVADGNFKPRLFPGLRIYGFGACKEFLLDVGCLGTEIMPCMQRNSRARTSAEKNSQGVSGL